MPAPDLSSSPRSLAGMGSVGLGAGAGLLLLTGPSLPLDWGVLPAAAALQPKGVLEQVGEHGSRLSGGQKQRIVIARSLYQDPDLIAFDEATAALDVQAERALTDYLQQFKAEKSMLAIAHRISTIKHCDRILYLEAGRLSGFGSFEQLKTDSGGFAKLASLSNL